MAVGFIIMMAIIIGIGVVIPIIQDTVEQDIVIVGNVSSDVLAFGPMLSILPALVVMVIIIGALGMLMFIGDRYEEREEVKDEDTISEEARQKWVGGVRGREKRKPIKRPLGKPREEWKTKESDEYDNV